MNPESYKGSDYLTRIYSSLFAMCCMSVYVCVSSTELQLVVEQHFQRHEQMEAGLSDSPDTPSPITAQQPNGAATQWAINSSTESYVSCDEQAGSSEMGGKWRSGQKLKKTFSILVKRQTFYKYIIILYFYMIILLLFNISVFNM